MKRLILVPFLVLALSVLVACGDEKEAKVKDDGDSSQVVEPGDVADEEEKGEPASTAAIGDLVEVAVWDVKVTKVVLKANSEIAKANEFNDKPKGQYVLVTYEATYTGDERTADVFADLTWTLTGSDQQVNNVTSAVTPFDTAETPTSARRGGTVKGQVVFDIAPELLSGALLTVEGYDAEFDTVFADFALPS